MADLGHVMKVSYVIVVNRNVNSQRLHDFNIGITDVPPTGDSLDPAAYRVCKTYTGIGPASAVLTLNCEKVLMFLLFVCTLHVQIVLH